MDELIRKAAEGDKQAFSQVVTEYAGAVYNTALRYCKNKEDAEDVSQEVFIKIFRYLPSFKFESSFKTFIYRVTVNTALDFLRKNKVAHEEISENIESAEPGIESKIIVKEREKAVENAISELSEELRDAVVLREYDGLSYAEIAEVLEVKVGTIKSRILRGREKIREKLLSDGTLFGEYESKLAKEEKEVQK